MYKRQIYSNPGEDIVINLLIFVAIQMFIFRRLYGGSDCLAYILCAMYLAGCGKDLTDYLLFMLLAVGLELIVQLKNNNINIKEGKLKQPKALIPVSYTHLDVYKRQGFDGTEHEWTTGTYEAWDEDTHTVVEKERTYCSRCGVSQ